MHRHNAKSADPVGVWERFSRILFLFLTLYVLFMFSPIPFSLVFCRNLRLGATLLSLSLSTGSPFPALPRLPPGGFRGGSQGGGSRVCVCGAACYCSAVLAADIYRARRKVSWGRLSPRTWGDLGISSGGRMTPGSQFCRFSNFSFRFLSFQTFASIHFFIKRPNLKIYPDGSKVIDLNQFGIIFGTRFPIKLHDLLYLLNCNKHKANTSFLQFQASHFGI